MTIIRADQLDDYYRDATAYRRATPAIKRAFFTMIQRVAETLCRSPMRWNGIRSISVCLRTRRATRCNGRSSSLRGSWRRHLD